MSPTIANPAAEPSTQREETPSFEPYPEPSGNRVALLARQFGRGLIRAWPPLLLFALFIVVWQWWTATRQGAIAYVPQPLDVYRELVSSLGFYWHHAKVTLQEAFLGYLLGASFALSAAVMMAEFRTVERALMPFAIMLKVTPAVAFAPALIVWLGFGIMPKVIIAALIVFFPLMVNALTGFRSVDENALEVFRSVKASRLEIFWQLRVPNSLPYLFSAAKITVPLAIIGAVVAEFYNSFEGLGNVLVTSASNLRTARLYGAIVVLVIIGLTLNFLVNRLEKRMLRWHSSQSAGIKL